MSYASRVKGKKGGNLGNVLRIGAPERRKKKAKGPAKKGSNRKKVLLASRGGKGEGKYSFRKRGRPYTK